MSIGTGMFKLLHKHKSPAVAKQKKLLFDNQEFHLPEHTNHWQLFQWTFLINDIHEFNPVLKVWFYSK